MEIKKPFCIFLITKIFTWLSFVIATIIIYQNKININNFFFLLGDALCAWDCGHYGDIVNLGYDKAWRMAFFPFYLLIVKLVSILIKNVNWSGVLVSNIALLISVIYFYNLIKEIYSEKTSKISLVLFLTAPTALFYIIFHTEALFFMLVVMSFYYMHKKNFLIASILGLFASATRNIGILILIPFIIEYYNYIRENNRNIELKFFIYSALIASGLVFYMLYSYILYKDFFLFINAQKLWADHQQLAFPFKGYLRAIKHINEEFSFKFDPMRTNLGFLFTTAGVMFLFYGYKKLKIAHYIYLLIMVLFFSILNRLSCNARYLSAVFPLWIILAIFLNKINKKYIYILIIILFLIWQFYMIFRWSFDMWVS